MPLRLPSLLFVCFVVGCAGRAPVEDPPDVEGEGEGEGEGEDDDVECWLGEPCAGEQVCVSFRCRERCPDGDGDGACVDFDLDDDDAAVSPFTEQGDNGVDDNGDGRVDEAQLCFVTDDCSNPRMQCFGGSCHYTSPFSECAIDADCFGDYRCDGGVCNLGGGCDDDVDCGSGAVCRLGACRMAAAVCFADAGCDDNQVCVDGLCDRVMRTAP